MSDSENTEGHGQSVPEDPEQPAQHQQDASQNGGLTVDDILDTPQLSLIHISEPTRQCCTSRMPSSA